MKSWMMCLGVVALLGGCDASKNELESTKTTLNSVTSERDNLRTQNADLQKQLDATKAQLAKATTPASPAAGATAATTASKTTKTPDAAAKHPAAEKGKHAHKS
ncbi:MAG TPA: hypothetical protein VHB97_22280 [Polyangia bacterium]|nr:hypothetical protein [Polyangia bacterium]